MPLIIPAPSGGRAESFVKVSSDGNNIGDENLVVVANGSTGGITVGQYGVLSTQPLAATPYWLFMGRDSAGVKYYTVVYA